MNQKERDTQRALGNMEEFRVIIMVPIKVNVRMVQNVEAVSEEDAIEKMKMIHDIIPDSELLSNALSKARDYDSKAEFDTTVDRVYKAQQLHKLKDCDTQCDSGGSGGSI
jgi:hypothetical protein